MREIYNKYQNYLPALFFVSGFVFDLLTTRRIDQSVSLIQQFVYLLLIMILIYWEVCTPKSFLKENSFANKIWSFHIETLHFLFGSLLSLYTIFYFKSSSLMTSFLFMLLLAGLLLINELPTFKKKGLRVRSALLALCLSSYFIYLVPVVTGALGVTSFVLAMVLSVSLYLIVCVRIDKVTNDKSWLNKNILAPGLAVQFAFVLLYFLKVLPPVPVSIKYIGVYHHIERQENQFVLSYERDWWRFWQSGAQTFSTRQDDRIYCFVSIFSPTQFEDRVRLQWLHKDKDKGWRIHDNIPLVIKGGREQGFRGFAYKSNFSLGQWQVRVQTSDNREVGRIYFNVQKSNAKQPRQWRQDFY